MILRIVWLFVMILIFIKTMIRSTKHMQLDKLLYNCPKIMKTLLQNPNINPIEHLWAELKARVKM